MIGGAHERLFALLSFEGHPVTHTAAPVANPGQKAKGQHAGEGGKVTRGLSQACRRPQRTCPSEEEMLFSA